MIEGKVSEWRKDPVAFVKDNFEIEPDKWQADALVKLPHKRKFVFAASAGCGKSTFMAWVALWFLVCWGGKGVHPKGAAVSGLGHDNLQSALWAEITAQLKRSRLLSSLLEITTRKVYLKDAPETWFVGARSFANKATDKEKSRVLSGLHADSMLYLVDEAGDLPVATLQAAEQGLSMCSRGWIIVAGNPTTPGKMLQSCFRDEGFESYNITSDPEDPNRSGLVSKAWAQAQIDKFGREDEWVKVYILGQFPDKAFNALLGTEEVEEAMGRGLRPEQFVYVMKRFGVDVARFGDDSTIICRRQGKQVYPFIELRMYRGPEIAQRILNEKSRWISKGEESLIAVDGSGGYGSTVVDSLRMFREESLEVNASRTRGVDKRYFNSNAEMCMRLRDWVREGGALPNDKKLAEELTSVTYTFRGEKVIMEPKDRVKERIGRSPDRFDALKLTFALPDKMMRKFGSRKRKKGSFYDWYDREIYG